MKEKQTTSLLERLKICWNVLTKKNYVYFGIGKEPVIWDDNGKFKHSKDIRCYTYIDDNYKFNTNDGIRSLYDITWSTIEKFAKDAQINKH